ncbi:MAG TPA: RNA polymerase sigma factor [Thermoanaerobaculia bacterium]|nr:RNA polymerase sigma factor [Thermoanaerobaculia bacterium]
MLAPNPNPDLFLARRAAAGQAEAWDELIEKYGQRLYNLAYHFGGSAEEAEDLTQEIFLRLYQNLHRYTGEAPLAAWALRLSRNLCIDHYRRIRRDRRTSAVPDEILAQMPAADDVQEEAQRREEVQAVYGALSELPEESAEVVLLRDLQGWTMEEIAAYLGVPLGTIKSRLHRARLSVAERLAPRFRSRWSAEAGPAHTGASRPEASPC